MMARKKKDNEDDAVNPIEPLLRMDRMPHIWCPACGIGTTVNCFARALEDTKTDLDKTCVISGIGCTGRVAGYMNLDSFHTTHGRPIPFATGLKLANPELNVVVYSGDGDLIAIGGNHFIHAARRNVDMLVICVNNYTYGMTGGQLTPTTPYSAVASTAPYGNFEKTFSLPYLADSCGAAYVARWTTYHVRQVAKSMTEAMGKRGFRFIEIISPCPTLYQRRNKLGSGLDFMKYLKEKSVRKDGADTRETRLDFQSELVIGKFVDREMPTWLDDMNRRHKEALGDKYQIYKGIKTKI